jgi:hypothetical protein
MRGDGWKVFDANLVTWFILLIVVFSLVQGIKRGASGSVKQLLFFLVSSIVSVVAIILSALAASYVSPHLKAWLTNQNFVRPKPDTSFFAQFGYTALSGLRDLSLFRFSALFLVIHTVIRILTGLATRIVATVISFPFGIVPTGGAISRTIGGVIGTALGTGRALLFTSVLFAYCALFPQGPMTDYIGQSGMYREVAAQVIKPATGGLLAQRLPIFAHAMTSELDQLWQKRYDVIDANLPNEIVLAAASVTKGKTDEESKARALYDWVGSRIEYDNDKVRAYEEKGDWREQNPEQTFATRKGVCIDYARLYAAMARSVGLDVRVVTGLGYDGRGSYGPHAWNEVYLTKRQKWISLDTTWAKTGNWFDSPGFNDTHKRQGGLTA